VDISRTLYIIAVRLSLTAIYLFDGVFGNNKHILKIVNHSDAELHAGPNFATRPAKIHEFLDPTRPDAQTYPEWVKITRRLASYMI